MRALIQRVKHASVSVDGQEVGAIEQGVLAYIGLGHDDNLQSAQRMIDKILTYRIFDNDDDPAKYGKLDKNVQQVGGGLLLVSQFTLMAKTDKGRRPDFGRAMAPDMAQALFAQLVDYAKTQYLTVATGQFGADMQVLSVNDGPLNFLLEVH
ncbi:D-tyrosyl-tRNA(Tyr) deacylase [Psychrobacter cryohalolentis]|uniref:D-aminoacyl-tRNA deacylase n=1 Tax=Psychrobacter sp. D2 TaxID=2759702 RepID=UPI0015E6280C|nr:D-aminoacyl-tRNA deacylase [Psychrobacter sp. D2]MBA2058581.1 D-tyrosyl-tRNA(Tyr) deacylase [Psychrobacter sp. D2]